MVYSLFFEQAKMRYDIKREWDTVHKVCNEWNTPKSYIVSGAKSRVHLPISMKNNEKITHKHPCMSGDLATSHDNQMQRWINVPLTTRKK